MQLGLLAGLSLFASIAEVFSIGAILPFLDALTNPDRIFAHPRAQWLVGLFDVRSPAGIIAPVAAIFAAAAVASGAMRLLLMWANTRMAFAIGSDLSNEAYRRVLYQPYAFHVRESSSRVISSVGGKTARVITDVVFPILNMTGNGVILLTIVALLVAINPPVILSTMGGFAACYLAIMRHTRRRLRDNGAVGARAAPEALRALQEGLGGIRDVLIDGTQQAYCDLYRSADLDLRRSQAANVFLWSTPRFVIETLGIAIVAGIACILARRPGGMGTGIATMGAMALGAQRILPLMQGIYAHWSSVQAARSSLRDSLEVLELPLPDWADRPAPQPIGFAREIRLRDVSFRYAEDAPWVIRHLDLVIEKGARVGIIGRTGSGKSTLLDVMMALLAPTEGALEIDGEIVTAGDPRPWQVRIAHVPQAIHLSDASIEQNIAFGVPPDRIDRERVRGAARRARIADAIEALPEGYLSRVGERGIRLSGGERQRVGIARALYKNADVLVLDEATSALDHSTEESVMEAVAGLGREATVVIVAHRLTTLRACDKLIELDAGRIVRVGPYDAVVGEATQEFRVTVRGTS